MNIYQLRTRFPDEKACRQLTVTCKTPTHSTELPLWKWLLAIYYRISSSKGVTSVVLAKSHHGFSP